MDVYVALGIRKEQIDKRQAWQNYVRRVGASWNTCIMQERLKAKASRTMTYLEGKPEEDSSMSITWRRVEDM